MSKFVAALLPVSFVTYAFEPRFRHQDICVTYANSICQIAKKKKIVLVECIEDGAHIAIFH